MRRFYLICLSIICLVNIGWGWRTDPKVVDLAEKGYYAWREGNATEALNYYEQALMLKPDELQLINAVGVVYEELGVPEKAKEKYLTAIQLNKRYLPSLFNLATLYWNQGNLKKAEIYFRKRVQYGLPQDPWTIKAAQALKTIEFQKKATRKNAAANRH